MAGDTAGGEVGFSVSMFASKLNAFAFDVDSLVGGVAVRDDAPDSSPARPKGPPAPSLARPLLLRLANMEVGPKVAFCDDVRMADPLSLLKSSMPTWFWFCCGWP